MWILMRHPNLPETQTITVPEEVVPGHETAGWEVVPVDGPLDSAVWPDASINDPAEPDNPAE